MPSSAAPYGYCLSRSKKDDRYGLWSFDPTAKQPFTKVPLKAGASFPRDHKIICIGGFLLEWSPVQQSAGNPYWNFRLIPFQLADKPAQNDPLNTTPIQHGQWPKLKFWGRTPDFGNPTGGHKAYDESNDFHLLSLGTFAMCWIPTVGRGNYGVWSFDPCPVPADYSTVSDVLSQYTFTPQASFRDIDADHELIAFNNYVLDRHTPTSMFRLWSFDPQNRDPLSYPAIQQATHLTIKPSSQLAAVGDYLIEWSPRTLKYRVWRVDPKSADILVGPVSQGTLPAGFTGQSTLFGFQPNIPINAANAKKPGTIDYMRTNVKHVVYYMLENRSFDHIVGWLHAANAKGVHIIGPDGGGPYKGASTKMSNVDPVTGKTVYLSKYMDGKLNAKQDLELFDFDPYHDLQDTLRQYFYKNRDGYEKRATPEMDGFIWNNSSDQVMQTYTPTQLPVLNGLAGDFAISDEWFCGLPASTDANRAFALTGSSMGEANNFMSPPQYDYWPEQPHRPSFFKLLWCNGMTSWKIYNSTQWQNFVFTYQLFLENQIPTVDNAVKAGGTPNYVEPVANFYSDALAGTLPTFSLIEPVWIGGSGTTSYHPGADLVLGERQLNQVYDAISKGPGWENTVLVITFDEHGGIFDHVAPPYAERPWPHDVNDGFHYDLLGPRVPTIVVSPYIEPKTIFRSTTPVAYDATSFMATLLHWCGIPKERWFMGDRTQHAPTFEGILTRTAPRTDKPTYTPPYDVNYPPNGPAKPVQTTNHLAEYVARTIIVGATRGKLSPDEVRRLSHDVITGSKTMAELTRRLDEIVEAFG